MFQSLLSVSNVGMSGALARVAGFSRQARDGAVGQKSALQHLPNPRWKIRDGMPARISGLAAVCDYIGRSELAPEESWADRHSDHGHRNR
ncbi:MAG: hypothetical protein WDN48_20640 [Pseudolabrys sp.]